MRVALILLSICLVVTLYLSHGRASEPAPVVSAVAPVYPVIALAAHARGDLVVRVDIKSTGEVGSARALSGHNLLQKVSVDAARRWRFSTSNEDHRDAELTFTFQIVPDKTNDVDRTPVFYPPYHLEVRNQRVVTTTNYER